MPSASGKRYRDCGRNHAIARAVEAICRKELCKRPLAATDQVMALPNQDLPAAPAVTSPSNAVVAKPASIPRSYPLTDRDLRIHAWLDSVGAATVPQIRRRFSLGRSQTYHRIRALAKQGLLRRHDLVAGSAPAYAPIGRTIRWSNFAHTLALTDLIIHLELEGREVVGEIEIRRQAFGEGRLGDRLSEDQVATVSACDRVPDAVEVQRGGGLVSYEIELSSKGRSRRERILANYAASRYERVVWIVPDSQLRRLLTVEITEMGLMGFMEVSDRVC